MGDELAELIVQAIKERYPELGGENRTVTAGRMAVTPLNVLGNLLAGPAGGYVIVRLGITLWFEALREANGIEGDAGPVDALQRLAEAGGKEPPDALRRAGIVDAGMMVELALLVGTRPRVVTPPLPNPTIDDRARTLSNRLPLAQIAAEVAEHAGERLVAQVVEQHGPRLLEWLRQITAPAPPVPRRPGRRGAAARSTHAPQATFPAARELGLALADGPTGRHWTPLPADVGIVHALAGASLRTELVGSAMAEWFGTASTPPALLAELQRAGLPAVLLLNECIALVLENRDYVDIALDDLIPAAGWSRPRSGRERERMRSSIWRWLTIFHAARVVGGRWRTRPGRGGDPVPMRDSLVVIGGIPAPVAQLALDASAVPEWVSLGAGPYLAEHRGDRRMLTDVGSVRRIAAIPAGKPAGAWAQALALTLNQHWRTHAASPGSEPHLSRVQLLDSFQPQPTVHEILTSSNPKRARAYFDAALRLAQARQAIGPYQEPDPVTDRQGWTSTWLTEVVDVQPPDDVAGDLSEIAASASRHRQG